MARGLLGRHSPIQARQKRGEALKEADVVIMLGAVADFRLGYGRVLSRRSKIIAVNRSKEQLYKVIQISYMQMISILCSINILFDLHIHEYLVNIKIESLVDIFKTVILIRLLLKQNNK